MLDAPTWAETAERAHSADTTRDDAWALEQERRAEAGNCLHCIDGRRYEWPVGFIPCTSCDGTGEAPPVATN